MTHLLLHKTPNSVSSEPGAAHTDTESEKSTEIVLAAFADCILRGWHDRCGRAFALEIAPDHSLKK
jgi:hypothetical protein